MRSASSTCRRLALLALLSSVAPACGGGDGAPPAPAVPTDPADLPYTPPTYATVLVPEPVADLTWGLPAEKARLAVSTYARADGTYETVMVAAFQLCVGPEVWDWAGSRTPARDIYVARSVDGGATWSAPIDVSGMAAKSSRDVDHDGKPSTPPVPYAGDCGKPALAAQGKTMLLAWEGRYVPAGAQGVSAFEEAGGAEIPFSAVYAARSLDGGATWNSPQRLTDGSRDANETVVASSSAGYALVWQEDALGLQPGDGEGPGDGGSGARVSSGTDLWYSALTAGDFAKGKPFPAPVAVTDNALPPGAGGAASGGAPAGHEGADEGGGSSVDPSPGASRPVLFLVGKSGVLAYEETKGGGGGETAAGKYVRYHVLADFVAPLTTDATLRVGTILSDPGRNGRRPRLIVQQTAGTVTGLRLLAIWREGVGNCGTSADIVGRVACMDVTDAASTGLRPEDMVPAVDPTATSPLGAAASVPAWNLTSTMGLGADSEDDPLENARAHRGVIRGDKILLAYVWAAELEAADLLGLDSYELFVRCSEDAGATWSDPQNLSRLADPSVTVVEPRLAPTSSTSDPAVLQAKDVVFLSWATQQNFAASPTSPVPQPLDILVARTPDFGRTWEETGALAATGAADQEAQLRASPDGSSLSAVWITQDVGGYESGVPHVHAGALHVESVAR